MANGLSKVNKKCYFICLSLSLSAQVSLGSLSTVSQKADMSKLSRRRECLCVCVFGGTVCARVHARVCVSYPVVCVWAGEGGEGRGVRKTWSFSQTPDSEHVKLFSLAALRPASANLLDLSGHQPGFHIRAPSRGEP